MGEVGRGEGEERGVTFAGKLQKQVLVPRELAALCSLLHHEIPLRNGIRRGWIGSRKSAHFAVWDYQREGWARTCYFGLCSPSLCPLNSFFCLDQGEALRSGGG